MLREKINDGVKEAMKSQDKLRLSTLRLVNAAIKNADIEARGAGKEPLDDGALLALMQKMIKQREELVELYDKGGRKELADQERGEIVMIAGFLPEADVRRRDERGDRRRDRRDRRGVHEGHGQGDRRAARQVRRPDGFRQGQRAGEGQAVRRLIAALLHFHCCQT